MLLLMEPGQGIATEAAHDLAAGPAGLDESGDAQPPQVPRHERLTEIDVVHEVRHSAIALAEALQHAQPGGVSQRLVNDRHSLQVSRWIGQACDGGSDAGRTRQRSSPWLR